VKDRSHDAAIAIREVEALDVARDLRRPRADRRGRRIPVRNTRPDDLLAGDHPPTVKAIFIVSMEALAFAAYAIIATRAR
jgi:hypothetical protein